MDERLQIANLIFFFEDRYIPEALSLQDVQNLQEVDRVYRCLALLESHLWLDLGVDLGFFPSGEMRTYASRFSGAFNQAYDLTYKTGAMTRFSDPLQRLLEIEHSRRRPQSETLGLAESGKTDRLLLAFRSMVLLSSDFVSDEEGVRATKLLALEPEQEWEVIRKSGRFIDGRQSEIPFGEIVAPSSLGEGYSRFALIARYMEDFRMLRPAVDLASVQSRIQELQQWRIALGNEVRFNRFDYLTNLAISVLRKEVPKINHDALYGRIRDLATDWGATKLHGKAATG